jgi:hypothetical protein
MIYKIKIPNKVEKAEIKKHEIEPQSAFHTESEAVKKWNKRKKC